MTLDERLPRRKALVTGASRGLGAAIAAALRARGTEVLAPSRAELDLLDPASIRAYADSAAAADVDILVNNAGINTPRLLVDLRDDEWAATLQTNLTAVMSLTRALAPGMRARRWGRIVNISSIFSLVTKERRSLYSATKAGLNGFTRAAAVELAPDGVLVNAVCPGYVDTELTRQNNSPTDIERISASIPLRRLARPEEIAGLVVFLCSEENTYVTGQSLVADGGFTCL
ncbi:MAG: SDR family oxidoreductase [Elusimicrobia bacterium]|nr:SDR family oxidoreductase [Elusimicrobiota bacterium]